MAPRSKSEMEIYRLTIAGSIDLGRFADLTSCAYYRVFFRTAYVKVRQPDLPEALYVSP